MSLLARVGSRLPPADVFAHVTDRARMARIDELVVREAATVARGRALLEGSSPSLAALDSVARPLLDALRQVGPLASLDQRLHDEREEIMDDPTIDPDVRAHSMKRLELLNESSGAHLLFARIIDQALGDNPAPHVYELAAGTGGLARSMGEHLRERRPGLRWTISDRDEQVLAASPSDPSWLRAEGRDLLGAEPFPDADLFLCVQAAHHLPPGLVLLLLHRGARARRGLLLLDVLRGVWVAGVAAFAATILARDRIVVLDGIQSARRAFTPAELALLARVAGLRVEDVGALGPAYLQLRATQG